MKRLSILAVTMLCSYSLHAFELRPETRKEVVERVAAHLQSEYVLPDVGVPAARKLQSALRKGAFDAQRTGDAFAAELTRVVREITGDGHLTVEFSEKSLEGSDTAAKEAFEAAEMERYYGAHVNFGVQKAQRLEGNIGLLELSVFPPSAMGGDTVAAAMQVVAHTDALIIDLRNNGGGSDTIALVASYLFDEPKPLSGIYDRPSGHTKQHHTLSYVPGAKFGEDKPVYVLISKRTFSAAEALAYDLQALQRATIIGQPSGGGAHPFEYKRIHPHFVLWSVTQKSINPITKQNWQGIGVQPDVRVEPEKALDTALELIAKARQ